MRDTMFNEAYNNRLSMFDGLHLLTLLVIIILIGLLYVYRFNINNERFEKRFRIILGVFLFGFELGFHLWVLSLGSYALDMIPLTGFCALTNLATIIALLSNKKEWFNYIIYFALTGAFFALVFVDTTYGAPHFRYFHYFLVHTGFIIASLYYFFTGQLNINLKHLKTAMMYLLGYSVIVLVLDITLQKNWFYLLENPIKEISDTIGSPFYTVLWMLTIALLITLWFGLLKLLNRKLIKEA